MKKILILLLFSIKIFISDAQSLTFDDLLYLQKSGQEKSNDFLVKKGWSFIKSEKNFGNPQITWAYNYNVSKANAWVTQSQYDSTGLIITYQTSDNVTYTSIKNTINTYEMKLINSITTSNKIKQVYQGKNFTIEVSSMSNKDGVSPYFFKLRTNTSYNKWHNVDDANEILYGN